MIKQLLFLFLCIGFISCNNNEENTSKVTWIGGEIVNPKLNYVIISKDYSILDTVALNENNFFLYNSESLCPGLYSFNHYEYQMFYLEPGDSLMLRVNTVDFDESLAFSGRGAEQNNLLMEFFLLNEAESKLVPGYYQLSPKAFQKKLDSLNKNRMALYNEFVVKNPSKKNFKAIAKANINYDSYNKKELYTSAYYSNKSQKNAKDFPKNFYNYRKKVDYGSEELQSHYPYYKFLNRLFDNLAYENYMKIADFDRHSFLHTSTKLKILDSLITNEPLKNRLLRTNVYRFLLNGNEIEKGEEIVSLFSKFNTDEKYIEDIKALSKFAMQMAPGKKIPNVFLLSSENTVKDLHSTLKKPTVLFFWSSQSIKHFRDIHTKAAELYSKYPEYDFIGINTDTHFKKWRGVVAKSGYDKSHEFQFDDIDDAEKKLVINSANKAIIIDESGIILKSNTSLFDQNIEAELLGYLNKK